MILSIMTVGVTSVSAADDASGTTGNLTWSFEGSTGTLTISGNGPMPDYRRYDATPWYYLRDDIQYIVISDGVTSISGEAFSSFWNSEYFIDVSIPDSITQINGGFTQTLIGHVDFPDSIVSISAGSFSQTSMLLNKLPENISHIGDYAFAECEIGDLVIPDTITYIGSGAFETAGSGPHNITITAENVVFGYDSFVGYYTDSYTVYTKSNCTSVIEHCETYNIPYVIMSEPEPSPQPAAENEITVSGNSGQSIVTLDYDVANLRVTVPTVLPVSVDSDNNVTVSDSAKIVNFSNGQVDVTNAVLSGSNSWTLAAFNTDFTKVPVDTKQYGFKLQGYSVPVSGNAYNSQFDTIDGDAALDLSYDANVAIQSNAISAAEIGRIVFTVAWHK